MGGSKTEVARSRETLSHLIELSGLSRREVEKRLLEQGCGTDLGRLLSGRLDLKLRHILDICRVIDIYPLDFFRIVFKETGQRSPLLQRLDAVIHPGKAQRAAQVPEARSEVTNPRELHQRLSEVLRQLERLAAALGTPRR
jgi:hypothetical protein